MSDPLYQYTKLFLENVSLWPFLVLFGLWWLVRHPEIFGRLAEHVSRMKVGGFEVELREIRAQIEQTSQQVKELENEVERENARFGELLRSFDPHAPVADLARAREALKAMAPGMEDLGIVRKGLAEGASAEEIYAAAEIARARRDPALFDDVVACLERLAGDATLQGIRLHTVWTLTSALHRMLIAEVRQPGPPHLSAEQLIAARAMLGRLVRNPRVLADRPDAPMQGVRGPAKWAEDWIEKALARAEKAAG